MNTLLPTTNRRGFTLIDVLVGTALMLIVFLGFFGAYRLGLKIAQQSRARQIAIAIAAQKIEAIRNLPYKDIGTIGGIPRGILPQIENITRDNLEFTIDTLVVYIDDPFDGLAPTDTNPNDYKRAKVEVSWSGIFRGGTVLMTDIAPKGLESAEGTGNLKITVFDAFGVGVGQAGLHVLNNEIDPPIDVNFETNNEGIFLVAGAPTSTQAYKITATKTGFSTDRTYGTEEVSSPFKPHTTVLEGALTEISFSIDRLSSFGVTSVSPFGAGALADSFTDESKISERSNVVISGGEVTLATTTATTTEYVSPGYLISVTAEPSNLNLWETFSWPDSQPPNTEIRYRVLYSPDGSVWTPIPDADLAGNEAGFTISPADISSLSTTTYNRLRLRGDLSTQNASSTPTLFDWRISWSTNETTAAGNVTFALRGNKTIGTDASENPVYKYSQNHTTNSSGNLTISGLEWDNYTFSINPETGLNLVNTIPSPQPISLTPNTAFSVTTIVNAENELLFQISDSETTLPVFGAEVRLFNAGLGYDQTQFTDSGGKTLFIPLNNAAYNYEITAVGYAQKNGTVAVSGDTINTIALVPQE